MNWLTFLRPAPQYLIVDPHVSLVKKLAIGNFVGPNRYPNDLSPQQSVYPCPKSWLLHYARVWVWLKMIDPIWFPCFSKCYSHSMSSMFIQMLFPFRLYQSFIPCWLGKLWPFCGGLTNDQLISIYQMVLVPHSRKTNNGSILGYSGNDRDTGLGNGI